MAPQAERGKGCSGARPCVLVLDPDPRISEALSLALRRVARVERAPRGISGLIATAEGRADVVIAQADLPDVFTSELLRLLRLLQPRLPIVILGERRAPLAWTDDEVDVRYLAPFDLKKCVDWIAARIARPPRLAGSEAGGGGARLQHAEIVQWALAYVERRRRDGTRLATIARLAGLSPSNLCRIFRRVTGESLKRFVTHRRLEEGKRLLRDPLLTIQQVASVIGYWNLSRFDRAFRRWEGQSPSQYRYETLPKTVRPWTVETPPAGRLEKVHVQGSF